MCVIYVLCLSCFRAPCGHLLGKVGPLGSGLCRLIVFVTFPCGILGQVWYLIVSNTDLCHLFFYFATVVLIYRHWAIILHSENLFDKIALGKCEVPCTKKSYCIIIIYKTGDSWGGGFYWPQGHNLNKLGRGPLGNATNQIPRL